MSRQIKNTMILRFAYLLVSVGKAGKVGRKKCQPGALYWDVATQQTYRRYSASCHTVLWRDNRPEEKKRTK